VIDELETFNAHVTLALARHARFPTSADLIPNEIGRLEAKDLRVEQVAADTLLGRNARWFDIYLRFWKTFTYAPDRVSRRLTLNAPPGALSETGFAVLTDPRLGSTLLTPEPWAAGLGRFDDFTLFSDEHWSEDQQQRMLDLMLPGATVTLLRPSLRCRWFELCRVRHDFSSLVEKVEKRFAVEHIYAEEEPVMVTVIGLRSLK